MDQINNKNYTLKIKDKYTPGELMKKLKNNRYSCR